MARPFCTRYDRNRGLEEDIFKGMGVLIFLGKVAGSMTDAAGMRFANCGASITQMYTNFENCRRLADFCARYIIGEGGFTMGNESDIYFTLLGNLCIIICIIINKYAWTRKFETKY